jgi:hypothetical protein
MRLEGEIYARGRGSTGPSSAVTRPPRLVLVNSTVSDRGGRRPLLFPHSFPQPQRRRSTGCALISVSNHLRLRFPPRYYSHLTSFTLSLHMLAAISPPAHDLSQSMPYSHTRTTSRSTLPDLSPTPETKTCPGCQQTVMDENGGVVIAFG